MTGVTSTFCRSGSVLKVRSCPSKRFRVPKTVYQQGRSKTKKKAPQFGRNQSLLPLTNPLLPRDALFNEAVADLSSELVEPRPWRDSLPNSSDYLVRSCASGLGHASIFVGTATAANSASRMVSGFRWGAGPRLPKCYAAEKCMTLFLPPGSQRLYDSPK